MLEEAEQRPIKAIEEKPEALLAAGAVPQPLDDGLDRLARPLHRLPRLHRRSPKSWKAAQKKGAEASVSTVCPLAVVMRTGLRMSSICACRSASSLGSPAA